MGENGDEKLPISVVVMTRNEAANITRCLAALRDFDEVFVVDSHSTDATVALAQAAGARVMPYTWNGQYPKKKQWCLDHVPCQNKWVFLVDADEFVTPALVAELRRRFQTPPSVAAFYVDGQPMMAGHLLRFGWWFSKISLLDKTRARFLPYDDIGVLGMGEVEGHYQPVLDGPAGHLCHGVIHGDQKPFRAWVARHNDYSDWEATLRRRKDFSVLSEKEPFIRRKLKKIFNATPLSFRSLLAFFYSYIVRFGFLDGRAGFHHALSRAFYYWLIAVKTWEQKT